eukprot:COSAG05_NODE_477_length_9434_cov_1.772319_6_plen_88_part_00
MHFSENESQLATRRKTESVAEIRVQDWFASKKQEDLKKATSKWIQTLEKAVQIERTVSVRAVHAQGPAPAQPAARAQLWHSHELSSP